MSVSSINKFYLEDYRLEMLELVDKFFEVYNDIDDLTICLSAFEHEMYNDNNLADHIELSMNDMSTLRDINIEVLDYVTWTFFAMHGVPSDINEEIKEFFNNPEWTEEDDVDKAYYTMRVLEILQED